MKIGWIINVPKWDPSRLIDGGAEYSKKVWDVLSDRYDLEIKCIGVERGERLLQFKQIRNLLKIKGEKDLWIRGYLSTITLPFDKTKGKNLLRFFHVDRSVTPFPGRMLEWLLEKIFYTNIKKIDVIVTVSKYWQKHFQKCGHKDVRVIYPGFDLSCFNFDEREIVKFKKKYKLTEKPIIYIGNCQRAKGVVDVYQALKAMNVYLVTSGEKRVDIPAINLNLGYREYLLLLKASSVIVTMSKFKEGWCMTAHEAMLCKTPVVGSGLGGMNELLLGGNQIICRDLNKLKDIVKAVMDDPKIGEQGYNYAKNFTLEKFEKEWIKVIESLRE